MASDPNGSGSGSLTSLFGKASKVDPKLAGKIAEKSAKKFGLSPHSAHMVGSQVTSQMQKQNMGGSHAPGMAGGHPPHSGQHGGGGFPPAHQHQQQHQHQGYPQSSTGAPPGYPPAQQGGAYPPAQQPSGWPPAQQGGAYPPAQQGGAYPPAQPSGWPPAQQGGGNGDFFPSMGGPPPPQGGGSYPSI